MTMKKWILCLSLLVSFVSLVVAGNGYTAEKTKLVVGTTIGNESIYPFHLAVKNGYFEQEGVVLEMKSFVSGPSMMMSLSNGELNLNIATGYPGMLQAAAQGVDAKILLSMAKGASPVVASAKIKSFKDLDDKVIGTPGLGTLQHTLLSLAIKKYGIKPKKIIHGKVTDLPIFLEKGEIDAFSAWEWVAADAVYRAKGAAHYVLKWPVVENAECIAMGGYGKYIQEHPDVVKRFMRAYLRGVKYAIDNKKDMPPLLAKMFDRPEEMLRMALENMTVEDPDINLPSVKIMVEDAIDGGRIKKEAVPDIDAFMKKIIDQTMLKGLKQEVGLK
jgi:NitT/TauT family transport system substrate-binding protein